jgi:multisubunit Na+/H+ antiporter MnhF subunit
MIQIVQHRKIFASLLLLLFVAFYVNITFFPHSHQIGDRVITHSHFYGGITTTSHPVHSHSTGGYAVINELSLFLSLALVIAILSFVLTEAARFNYAIIGIAQPIRSHFGILPPRAPPVLS